MLDVKDFQVTGEYDEGTPRATDERLLELSIPYRGTGHAFVPMTKWWLVPIEIAMIA